jgi:hypothetical protein
MSVNSIESLSTSMAATKTSQDLAMVMLKKSIDSSSNSVAALLSSIPSAVPAVNLPANLGQNINTTA